MSEVSHRADGFEVRGLRGYTVSRCHLGYWWFSTTDVATFDWNEATQRHDIPAYRDYDLERRNTAKGAVAAAHKHARWVAEQMARLRESSPTQPEERG